jgi:hypothetical protein
VTEQISLPYSDNPCAQLHAELRLVMLCESARLTLQLLTTAVTIVLFRNGYLPGLLTRLGGEWAWMVAGAVAMAVMLATVKTIQCLREAARGLRAGPRRRKLLGWQTSHTQPSGGRASHAGGCCV